LHLYKKSRRLKTSSAARTSPHANALVTSSIGSQGEDISGYPLTVLNGINDTVMASINSQSMNAGFMPTGTPVEFTHDTTLNSINTSEIGTGEKPNFPLKTDMLSRNPYLHAVHQDDGVIMLGSVDINSHNNLHSAGSLHPMPLPFGHQKP
jgi:hypothetical protein